MDILKKQSRIRAVHAACRALGIDDDLRKSIQIQVTGKNSMKDMSGPQLSDLLNHLNRRAKGQSDNEWKFVFKLTADRQPHAKKIYRLAERIGAVQNPPVAVMAKAYIEGITQQMTGTEHPLEFCDAEQLHKVVQILETHCKRIGA